MSRKEDPPGSTGIASGCNDGKVDLEVDDARCCRGGAGQRHGQRERRQRWEGEEEPPSPRSGRVVLGSHCVLLLTGCIHFSDKRALFPLPLPSVVDYGTAREKIVTERSRFGPVFVPTGSGHEAFMRSGSN